MFLPARLPASSHRELGATVGRVVRPQQASRLCASSETAGDQCCSAGTGGRCGWWLRPRAQQPGGVTMRETEGAAVRKIRAATRAIIKRVPGWELPEQNAIDPRCRTQHATVGWCSLTSKVVNLRDADRVSLSRVWSTLAPGRTESPSFCGSCSRLKNIILSSPPLHLLFIILFPTTVEHGVSWIRCGAENLRPYLSTKPSLSCSLPHPDRFSTNRIP